MLIAHCYKCKRRIQGLFLVGWCVECDAEMTAEERAEAPQKVWEALHSEKFLAKWPTRESFREYIDAKPVML